jgi:hypothetical protein
LREGKALGLTSPGARLRITGVFEGWSSKPFIPLSERIAAEEIAKKMMRNHPKTKS